MVYTALGTGPPEDVKQGAKPCQCVPFEGQHDEKNMKNNSDLQDTPGPKLEPTI